MDYIPKQSEIANVFKPTHIYKLENNLSHVLKCVKCYSNIVHRNAAQNKMTVKQTLNMLDKDMYLKLIHWCKSDEVRIY